MKLTRNRTILTGTILTGTAVLVVGAVTLTACGSTGQSASAADQSNSAKQLQTYEISQPIPYANWSQYRQTLIDVENAMINGVATTTFFYNQGSATPFKSCPSIGFPVASTSQLTNPEQVHGYRHTPYTVPQQEPNGVFTGDSSGTYVVCVTPAGQKEIDYWEGFVDTEGGTAHLQGGLIVSDSSSVTTTTHK